MFSNIFQMFKHFTSSMNLVVLPVLCNDKFWFRQCRKQWNCRRCSSCGVADVAVIIHLVQQSGRTCSRAIQFDRVPDIPVMPTVQSFSAHFAPFSRLSPRGVESRGARIFRTLDDEVPGDLPHVNWFSESLHRRCHVVITQSSSSVPNNIKNNHNNHNHNNNHNHKTQHTKMNKKKKKKRK